MRYAGIVRNDIVAAPGVCLSFYVQGCPHKCSGCFNPETWDFNGGYEFTQQTLDSIIAGLTANGIHRTFCILGGEPLCEDNILLTDLVIHEVKKKYPDQKIWIWTGYTYDQLLARQDSKLKDILATIDGIVDGPFIEDERDITLQMRGSKNQQIIKLKD